MATSLLGLTNGAMESKSSLEALVAGIDRGIEAHLQWNQRLMRCSLLRRAPEAQMMQVNGHELCDFGQWFTGARAQLDSIDPELALRADASHASMHAAVRRMCLCVTRGEAVDAADLDSYEATQSTMVALLNELRREITRSTAHHDPLTGLPLRHSLHSAFESRFRDTQRSGRQLHLAMIDVDHFKLVNDRYGHPAGDDALRHVARLLAQCMRASDCLIRYGGEEFLAILVMDHEAALEQVARRMLGVVRDAPLELQEQRPLCLTVTIGLTRVRPGDSLDVAVKRADDALLKGKAEGRDRFIAAQP